MNRIFQTLLLLILSAPVVTGQASLQRVNRVNSDRGGFVADLKPFYHGVASGDPTSNSVVIWTRVSPDDNPPTISGNYFVSTDTLFTNLVTTGTFTTSLQKDYTVKIDLTGLSAGTTYYYYFKALNANSLVGRAKTCPDGAAVNNLKFAVVSCSNYEGGYFNAYGDIATRNDIDAVIHLGDYIYEYGAGTYGNQIPDRVNEPANEIITLADYRTRYSLYRLDEDLIRAHQQHTFINIWDDHESANDSYTDGAENHQANEGLWETRKAISKQVYFEWMPIRDNANSSIYKKVSYGNLCDLFMLDTRLEGRVAPPPAFDTPDNPVRTIISPVQFNWFVQNLKQSSARWKVVGNQVLFSTFNVGFAAGFGDGTPDMTNIDSIRAVESLFIDNWESYPTQRNAIIDTLRANNIDNVVIVTGDSHCSWAFDVTKEAVLYPLAAAQNIPQPNNYNEATGTGYTPATGQGSWAVEFGTPSISSPNFDESVGPFVTAQFEFLMNNPVPGLNANYNPHLKYVDLDRHGYFILDLKESGAQADYYYVGSVQLPSEGSAFGKGALTLNQENHITITSTPTAPKPVQDAPAPANPLPVSSGSQVLSNDVAVFSCFPNPAHEQVFLQIGLKTAITASIAVYDLAGKKVLNARPSERMEAGVYKLAVSLENLSAGSYLVVMENGAQRLASQKVIVK